MQHLLRRLGLNKYKAVLTECKELAKYIAGDQWTLGKKKYVTMERFWNLTNVDGINTDGGSYLGLDKCINFDEYIWF